MAITSKDMKMAAITGILAVIGTLLLRQIAKPVVGESFVSPYLELGEGGYGRPRSDIERAMAHYGITEGEYLTHPERYPLPERGTGLEK